MADETDTHAIEGSDDWPTRMRCDAAAQYLKAQHGLPVLPKTLRNWRAAGRGPKCRYLGTLPIYDRIELDRWVEEDALKAECPSRRTRRLPAQATT